ncbi:MAG: M23 family metallopeptidase [Sulfurospirillaceae bacterium]|nr:M23 family metallopeptidase [Sulfurospirillaceae bacterium]
MMKRKNNFMIVLLLLFLATFVGLFFYIYSSSFFEREAPIVHLPNKVDWNLKDPLKVKVEDNRALRFVRAMLADGQNTITLDKKEITNGERTIELGITMPKTGFTANKKSFELIVEAVDASKWNFFSGNKTVQKTTVYIDTKRPEVSVLSNSYKIIRGGVATVIFRAQDENMKQLYIETSSGKRFYPTPFYGDNYYISLLAWPSIEEKFSASVIAVDRAGNSTKAHIPYFLQDKKYKASMLQLKDAFLDGKIKEMVDDFGTPEIIKADKLEKFKFVNETLRKANETIISKMASPVPTEKITDFTIKPFYPLKNGAAVASFGDHRLYEYDKVPVSESYHVGIDLASTAQANIQVSSDGVVVYAQENGIYGGNMIISHGLGVYSLYGHCSTFLAKEGDTVKSGDVIAKTGVTGLALGDHLHFGILVQGVEVRPEEWMDKSWLEDNIYGVIKAAKKIIDK